MEEQRRPLLAQSRFDDPEQRIMFRGRHWVYAAGPLIGPAIAVGCGMILRGRGGGAISHAAGPAHRRDASALEAHLGGDPAGLDRRGQFLVVAFVLLSVGL
jgi:hypothetical protein